MSVFHHRKRHGTTSSIPKKPSSKLTSLLPLSTRYVGEELQFLAVFRCSKNEVLKNVVATVECVEDKGKKEVKVLQKLPEMAFGNVLTMFVSTYLYCTSYQ
jgi:hypothetical protein